MYKITSKVHTDNSYGLNSKILIKGHPKGAVTTVTPDEMEALNADEVFLVHKANGFITVAKHEEETPVEAAADTVAEDGLLGSSVQPPTFTLEDDQVVQLGDVVRKAFEDSKLTEKKWNKLPIDKREAAIQAVVDTLALKVEA